MKRCFFLIFELLSVVMFAQHYKIIESRHISDNSKDCRKIGNCISSRYLKNDTLRVTIYADNQFRDLKLFRDSFTVCQDTLSINLIDTTRAGNLYVFNKERNKMDTLETGTCWITQRMDDVYDTRRNEYTFTGFKNIPAVIQSDHYTLCNCPTQPIQFDIFNTDTINVINANGLKQGVWIRFFDSGGKEGEKYFDEGVFIGGKMFDKKGNDLHAIYQSENMVSIKVRDTLQEK
jgi:hypothetical protein